MTPRDVGGTSDVGGASVGTLAGRAYLPIIWRWRPAEAPDSGTSTPTANPPPGLTPEPAWPVPWIATGLSVRGRAERPFVGPSSERERGAREATPDNIHTGGLCPSGSREAVSIRFGGAGPRRVEGDEEIVAMHGVGLLVAFE